MFSWVKKQALPGPGLDLPAFLAEELGHFVHAEALVDRVLDQLARLLDAEDLHRPAAVLVRGHVEKGIQMLREAMPWP